MSGPRPRLGPVRLLGFAGLWALVASAALGQPHSDREDSPKKPTAENSVASPDQLADQELEWFEAKIRPLLVDRCYSCHSAEGGKTQGGLALDSKAGWEVGGDSGPALVPHDVAASLLVQAVEYRPDAPQMPPEEAGGKLPPSEIALLSEWVRRGALDPRTEEARRGGLTAAELRSWWSFQPLGTPPVPQLEALERGDSQQLDQFIRAKLSEVGLRSAAEAEPRALIRRATYDLTGLPPTPAEVDAFVANPSPTAYSDLIERLLASPHYGERWGRHWLDVVRYADTAGENTDHPIADAWRYRNWVIEAFNRDLPYDKFVREQIAGDVLHADDAPQLYAEGIISTGFLAIARRFDHDSDKHMHLTYEDTLDTLGKTFLGLSIACARCHDHKYDPISAEDYYALYGILASSRFSFPGCEAKQQPRDLVPLLSPEQWAASIGPHDRQLAEVDLQLQQLGIEPLFDAGPEFTLLASGEVVEGGESSLAALEPAAPRTLHVREGELLRLSIDPHGNYGADTTLVEWRLEAQDGSQRTWDVTADVGPALLAANPHHDRLGNAAAWWFIDGRGQSRLLDESVTELSGHAGLQAWRSGDNPAVFFNSTPDPIDAWTALAPGALYAHPAADGPVAIAWMSPLEGTIAISGRIVDAHPGGPSGVLWRLEHRASDHRPITQRSAVVGAERDRLRSRRTSILAAAPARKFAYAVVEGTPANARLHLRGDHEKLGEEVPRRWLELFGGEPLAAEAGSGRRELAQWLSDASNPLIARVMVNRIWQNHFGKGIVATPNDFGTRGQSPSHPELLDWLATRFVESGWSIKAMHRLIMNSATYRQAASLPDAEQQSRALELDPANRWLWRFERRRLSAEELRDSLLIASGQIDWSVGREHPLAPPESWSFTQHVPFTGVPENTQRSIYLLALRNRRQPFLNLFDGADPNASTPQRQVTTVPTQALYFMNAPFVHEQAEKLAARVLGIAASQRIDALFELVYQRSPTQPERAAGMAFLLDYRAALGSDIEANTAAEWQAYARVLLSSNEFLYLE